MGMEARRDGFHIICLSRAANLLAKLLVDGRQDPVVLMELGTAYVECKTGGLSSKCACTRPRVTAIEDDSLRNMEPCHYEDPQNKNIKTHNVISFPFCKSAEQGSERDIVEALAFRLRTSSGGEIVR